MNGLLLPLLLCLPPGTAPAGQGPGAQDPSDLSHQDLDLPGLQQRIDRVLQAAVPATVGLRVGRQSGTGVLVSADGLVLTAGHVTGEAGREVVVILQDGTELEGRTLGLNPTRDSGMVEVLDASELPFVPVPKPDETDLGRWCLALGHPGGYEEGRPPVPRLGRVRSVDGPFLETDCPVIFGDSGGPLLDLDGNLIGIHSRIEDEVSVNLHVPMSAYRIGWDRLRAGEEWRRGGVRLGVRGVQDHPEGGAVLGPPTATGCAASAGLKQGEVVVAFAGEPVHNGAQLRAYLDDVPEGAVVRLTLREGERHREVDVDLGGELVR